MIFYDTYSKVFCNSKEQLSCAGKIRYQAYRNVEAIAANDKEEFLDKYDSQINSKTCLIKEKDDVIAAVRASIYAPELNKLEIPCFEAYKSDLEKKVDLPNVSIVESNRFVVAPGTEDSKYLFKLQFRFIILNILKFNADYVVTAVRPKHAPFYRRILMHPISEPKKYPGIDVEMVLLMGDCRNDLQKVINQDPIFKISQEEIENYSLNKF
jgi:hypothetical protein